MLSIGRQHNAMRAYVKYQNNSCVAPDICQPNLIGRHPNPGSRLIKLFLIVFGTAKVQSSRKLSLCKAILN